MKYIRIKNNGLIEPQALHLLGASTKVNDNTKIGQFGSGNKYALAYLIRNKYELKIFSGLSEIEITTKTERFRDNDFELIYINGEKTSITTAMGKDWQFWQSLREIYCNAIDEGGHIIDAVQEIKPCENETHFYIENKRDAVDFFSNFDNYFATNKKVLFECSIGRILEKTGTECNIYRKGIRCYNTKKTSIYDYDFNDLMVDEDRLAKYFWQVEEKLWSLIYACDNKELILQILHNSGSSEFFEGCISDISTLNASNASDNFKETLHEINLAPKGFAGLLKPDEFHNHIIVPTKVFQSFRGILEDENVGDRFKVGRSGAIYREIEPNNLQQSTIKQALYFFEECHFEIGYPVKCAIFDDKDVLGMAGNEEIFVSDICLERGVNQVVIAIIEEKIHLKYKVHDETRDFQTSVITEFISYMKNANTFLL